MVNSRAMSRGSWKKNKTGSYMVHFKGDLGDKFENES